MITKANPCALPFCVRHESYESLVVLCRSNSGSIGEFYFHLEGLVTTSQLQEGIAATLGIEKDRVSIIRDAPIDAIKYSGRVVVSVYQPADGFRMSCEVHSNFEWPTSLDFIFSLSRYLKTRALGQACDYDGSWCCLIRPDGKVSATHLSNVPAYEGDGKALLEHIEFSRNWRNSNYGSDFISMNVSLEEQLQQHVLSDVPKGWDGVRLELVPGNDSAENGWLRELFSEVRVGGRNKYLELSDLSTTMTLMECLGEKIDGEGPALLNLVVDLRPGEAPHVSLVDARTSMGPSIARYSVDFS